MCDIGNGHVQTQKHWFDAGTALWTAPENVALKDLKMPEKA